MSGYLQRLVNAASGGGETVHPRTGSIFSPRVGETPALAPDDQDSEQVALPLPRAASPHVEPVEPPDRLARESRPTPRFPPASETPVVRTRDYAAPRVPRAVPDAVEAADHSDERTWEPRRRPADDRSTDRSLVRDTAEASPFVATPIRAREPGTRSAELRRLRSDRDVGQRARQADDIQIHIGRIEVIAVPPAAPRAAKAPDRSVSLEAYLSRRDGRPR
jgi:hypothetical protein